MDIHDTPCEHCPSAHYPPTPDTEDMLTWPDFEKTVFLCAWRPERLCRGYCDLVEKERFRRAGVEIHD